MNIIACASSENHAGHCSVFSPIAKFLNLYLPGDYGSAIHELQIVPCFAETIGQLTPREQKRWGRLPRVTFRRKKRKIETAFLSTVLNAYDSESSKIRPALTNQGIPEVLSALYLLRQKLTKRDSFDIERFLCDCDKVLQHRFASVDEIQMVEERGSALPAEPLDDPWLASDLDWDDARYHQDARQLLDAPFFWSRGDEFAPHGNDTGSDILELCLPLHKSGQLANSSVVYDIVTEWGIAENDWDVTWKQAALELHQTNSQLYTVRNQLAIAVAFAAIKYAGTVSEPLAHQAIRAIERELFDFVTAGWTDALKKEYASKLKALRVKLDAYTVSSSQ